jgi:hypothetical protein
LLKWGFADSWVADLLPVVAVGVAGSWIAGFAGFLLVVAVGFADSWVAGFAGFLPIVTVRVVDSWVVGFADLLPVVVVGIADIFFESRFSGCGLMVMHVVCLRMISISWLVGMLLMKALSICC